MINRTPLPRPKRLKAIVNKAIWRALDVDAMRDQAFRYRTPVHRAPDFTMSGPYAPGNADRTPKSQASRSDL